MKRKNKLPELLAPAGSFECLVAATEAGADAIYVGGKRFGARAFAKNFDTEELAMAVQYCHLHGVKLYVTVNTLILDFEMEEVVKYAAELWRMGVDALIISDLGAISEIRKRLPGLELHASTQMSIHNSYGADEAFDLGCSRVVLARELSLEDIKQTTLVSKPEIEVFLHGALCVCHSGQCLFSSLVGGRSGNRGECAQPCRLPDSEGRYPLSLKDLCYASHVRELIDSGVASLKIEGRMKSPSYVYTVTKIYRRLLDENRDATKEELEALRRAFSRGGFTDEYIKGMPNKVALGVRSESDKEDSRLEERKFIPAKKAISACVKIVKDSPSCLSFTLEDRSVTVYGGIPSEAKTSPLTKEELASRLSKLGNTYLSLDEKDIDITLDTGINLSPSELNALRREAAEKLQDCSRDGVDVNFYLPKPRFNPKKFSSAVFLGEAAGGLCTKDIDFDARIVSLMLENIPEGANGVYLPPVAFEGEVETIKEKLSSLNREKIKYALVENLGQIALAREYGFSVICDFRLNTINRFTYNLLLDMGCDYVILSAEATLPQARDMGGGVIVYGRVPLMLTERCFMKDLGGCGKCSAIGLTDRRGQYFPIIREYDHRNLILNSQTTYMGDKKADLEKHRINHRHFIFTTESKSRVIRVKEAFDKGESLDTGIRRIASNSLGNRAKKGQKNKKR